MLGVFEWRLSDRTRKANAALAGIGRTRRILLSDTLLADHSDDEIEVILAHELSHHVHRDIWSAIGLESTVLRFDFDIFSIRPTSTGSPVARSTHWPSLCSTSSGLIQRRSAAR